MGGQGWTQAICLGPVSQVRQSKVLLVTAREEFAGGLPWIVGKSLRDGRLVVMLDK